MEWPAKLAATAATYDTISIHTATTSPSRQVLGCSLASLWFRAELPSPLDSSCIFECEYDSTHQYARFLLRPCAALQYLNRFVYYFVDKRLGNCPISILHVASNPFIPLSALGSALNSHGFAICITSMSRSYLVYSNSHVSDASAPR
jgi:hypothetical protein